MTITRVSYIRKSLVLLYIDGEPAFKIDKETFILSPFKEGVEITDEELFELKNNSENKRAKERAMYLLGLKNYSKKELIRKIALENTMDASVLAAEKMEELGLINDRNYAELYASDLAKIKKYGKQRIKTELYRKGIDKYIIEEVLEEYETDTDNIINAIDRKYDGWREDRKIKTRAVAFLQRRGYSFDEINRAMRLESFD